MADEFRLYVRGSAEAARFVNRVALGLQDLRGFWPLVIPRFIRWMGEQFDTEGEYAGQPWAPLSEPYATRKAALYPGRGILQATGGLRQAASRPRRTVTPTSLTLTIDDPKLAYHQDGTARMPARPLIFGDPLPPQAEADIEEAARVYIDGLIGGARLA